MILTSLTPPALPVIVIVPLTALSSNVILSPATKLTFPPSTANAWLSPEAGFNVSGVAVLLIVTVSFALEVTSIPLPAAILKLVPGLELSGFVELRATVATSLEAVTAVLKAVIELSVACLLTCTHFAPLPFVRYAKEI